MTTPVFVVGAGFSLAANAKFASLDRQAREFAKRYPLACDLGVVCFGSSWDAAGDIEAAFSSAVRVGNRKPTQNLVKHFQTADYYLGSAEARDHESIYRRLLRQFPGLQFVSFNYDSLLEQVLLHQGLWNPGDGFGVPVEIGDTLQVTAHSESSKVQVIHLHGSVLLYAEEFSWHRREPNDSTLMMTAMDKPKFLFDPGNLGNCFEPFRHAPRGLGYRHPYERVIVPLRDKSDALREKYIQIVYARACELLGEAEQVIAVGYKFAMCDKSSFDPLLQIITTGQIPLSIVAPDARNIEKDLIKLYPRLKVHAVPKTLKEWAESNFHGL